MALWVTEQAFQNKKFPCSLVLVFFIICAAMVTACGAPEPEKLFSRTGHRWYEDPGNMSLISPDGRWVLFSWYDGKPELFSLATGKEDPARLQGNLQRIWNAKFWGAQGELIRLGSMKDESGWFVPAKGKGLERVSVPPRAFPVGSDDPAVAAFFFPENPDGGLSVGDLKNPRKIVIPGAITGTAFASGAKTLFVIARQPDGGSTLFKVDARSGTMEILRRDLDADPYWHPISLSSDGKRLYLALVGPKAPNVAERQQPDAPRWMDIYAFELATGRLSLLVHTPHDKRAPIETGGYLYWAQVAGGDGIVALPANGGPAHEVAAAGEVPEWGPGGRRIGFAFGAWRQADWGLNLDAGAVMVDGEARPTSGREAVISGNHEDFPPVWSPDGRWIAFHSHRAPHPVAYYDADGSADDIWIRCADDPSAPEIRLTDFGWEVGSPNWAPDGRRLLYSSWDKGKPNIDHLWVTTVDPGTGRAVSHKKLDVPAVIVNPQWAVWSPDGQEIAMTDHTAPGECTLRVLHGTTLESLVAYKTDTMGGLDYMPDGMTIVYSALDDGRMQIFSIPRSGGTPRKLSDETANLLHPRVSPDGRWIACTRMEIRHEIWRKKL